MKFTVNIEATPEEARAFIGLPDIAGMQERLIAEMEQKMASNIRDLDPETLVRTWVPIMTQGWTDLQKNFWAQMGVGMPDTPSKPASKK